MSPAGTRFRRLTSSRNDEGDPAWSPDGREIAFTRWSAPNEHVSAIGAIYTIRRDGTHEKHLLGGPKAGYSASGPAWSPAPGVPTLGYGQQNVYGGNRCRSQPTGITCTDVRYGKGFLINRDGVTRVG